MAEEDYETPDVGVYLIIGRMDIEQFGLHTAAYLALLKDMYGRRANRKEGICVTQKRITEELGLSPYQQTKALSILKKAGVITVERRGLSRKNYYSVNF